MNPEEAVQAHIDLKAKHSMGIHWGTFSLTGEDVMEPPLRLQQAVIDNKIGEEKFVVYKHGETRSYSLS